MERALKTAVRRRTNKESGFTIIELMFVVAIIGVLSMVAIPGYGMYILKTKRTEAVLGLHQLWDLQEVYYAGHDEQYASDFDALGFDAGERIDATTSSGTRYVYEISQPWGTDSWYCSATANLDGDEWPDVLISGRQP